MMFARLRRLFSVKRLLCHGLFLLLLLLCSCKFTNTTRDDAYQGNYADSLLNLADVMPADSGVLFLHKAYRTFPKPRALDWYKKYHYLYYAEKNMPAAQLIYADSMLYALRGMEHDTAVAPHYVIALLMRGEALADNQIYTEAFKSYLKARKLDAENTNTERSMDYYRELGNVSKRFGRYREALGYFKRMLRSDADTSLASSFEAFVDQQSVYIVMGTVYEDLDDNDSAAYCYKKALKLNTDFRGKELDGGFYKEITRAYILYPLANIEAKAKMYDSVEKHLRESIRIFNRENYNILTAQEAMYRLGKVFFTTERYAACDTMLSMLRASLDRLPCDAHELEWHLLSSKMASHASDYQKAYWHLSKYQQAQTQVENNESHQVLDLAKEFARIEQDDQIDRLKKENRQTYVYVFMSCAIALMMLVIAFLLWKNSRQRKRGMDTLMQLNLQTVKHKEQLERAVKLQHVIQVLTKTTGWEYQRETNEVLFVRESDVFNATNGGHAVSLDEFKKGLNVSEKRLMNAIALYTARKARAIRIEREVTYDNQEKKWLRVIVEPLLNNGVVTGSVGAIQDISFEKRSEARLHQVTLHLQTLMVMMEDIIFELDAQKIFRHVWVRDERLLFLPKLAFIGKTIDEIFGASAPLFSEPIDEVLKSGGPVEIEYKHLDPSIDKWYKAKTILIHDRLDVSGPKIVISVQDITIRKTQELALEDVRKRLEQTIAEKERIMQVLIHDLRSPLSGIHSVSSMMLDKHHYSETEMEMLTVISDTSQFLYKMVNDLVDLSMPEETAMLEKAPVDFGQIVKQTAIVLQFKAKEKFQQIQIELEDDLRLLADGQKLKRVVVNLLTNAIKFSPEYGQITIRAKRNTRNLLFEVEDNGIGIPDDLAAEVFDVFTRAKRFGTKKEQPFGIGLSICKQIVDAHGGKIWFNTRVGEGTTFMVDLPLN